MTEELSLIDISDELFVLNKHTIDTLFSLDKPEECITLYMFYYKTAKWQKTDIIRANDEYLRKTLKWGTNKIMRAKQTLKEHGLIEIVQRRKDNKIDGWFVKIHYIISKNINLSVPTEEQELSKARTIEKQELSKPRTTKQETNALRYKYKCLKIKDNNIYSGLEEKTTKFIKPTLDEVKNYCLERKNKIDAEYFIDYYNSNGWKVGKNSMKDWKACIRTWEKNNYNCKQTTEEKPKYDTETVFYEEGYGTYKLNEYGKRIIIAMYEDVRWKYQ